MRAEADVLFYFDADILGLAHVICTLRLDCTYPGDVGFRLKHKVRPVCPITSAAAKDREWIPEVASRGWIAITRDANIQDHVSLMQAVLDSGLRLVTLAGGDGRTKWGQLEIVLSQWRKIDALRASSGPRIVVATRTGFREVDIEGRLARLRDGGFPSNTKIGPPPK